MTTTPSAPPAADPKRPYVAPALVIHGDVQIITQMAGPDSDPAIASSLGTP